jgi:hypothetical protein
MFFSPVSRGLIGAAVLYDDIMLSVEISVIFEKKTYLCFDVRSS